MLNKECWDRCQLKSDQTRLSPLTWLPPPHSNNKLYEYLDLFIVAHCGRFGRLLRHVGTYWVGWREEKRPHQSTSVMLTLSVSIADTHQSTHSPAAARHYYKTNIALQWNYKRNFLKFDWKWDWVQGRSWIIWPISHEYSLIIPIGRNFVLSTKPQT